MSEARGGPPQSLATLTARDPMFSHDEKGNVISRERTCLCGRRFTQRLLSARFLAMCERQSRGAIDAVTRDVPDYFVPVNCPPCERRDIAMSGRVADAKVYRNREERDYAAD